MFITKKNIYHIKIRILFYLVIQILSKWSLDLISSFSLALFFVFILHCSFFFLLTFFFSFNSIRSRLRLVYSIVSRVIVLVTRSKSHAFKVVKYIRHERQLSQWLPSFFFFVFYYPTKQFFFYSISTRKKIINIKLYIFSFLH